MSVKVMGITAGRKDSNSEILLKEALMYCEEAGAEITMVNLKDYHIESCTGCTSCTRGMAQGKNVGCVLDAKDDNKKIMEVMLAQDAVIFSAPTYDLMPNAEYLILGDALHHCVGTYAKDHANGKTAIFFIRRAKAPRKSFYTLELNEGKLVVRQNRGRRNCARTKEVEELEAVWLAWLKAGAPRDAKGRPVVPEQSKQKEVTAA